MRGFLALLIPASWRNAAIRLLALAFFAMPGNAHAQTCNNTLIGGLFYGFVGGSVTSLSFGSYSPAAGTPQQSNFTVTLSCTGGLIGGTLPPFTLALNAGSGTIAQRTMTATGGTPLKYQIYTSAGLSTVWGDGTAASSTVPGGGGSSATQVITGYGLIPAGQYVTPGSYTDTITITLTY
jgi:spore coat protein U-like protein